MIPSLTLLSCESWVSVKKTLIEKKIRTREVLGITLLPLSEVYIGPWSLFTKIVNDLFWQKSSTIDVWQGPKYTSVYCYIWLVFRRCDKTLGYISMDEINSIGIIGGIAEILLLVNTSDIWTSWTVINATSNAEISKNTKRICSKQIQKYLRYGSNIFQRPFSAWFMTLDIKIVYKLGSNGRISCKSNILLLLNL